MSASLIGIMCESGKSQLYRRQLASMSAPILKVSLAGCIPRSYQLSDAAILCLLFLSQHIFEIFEPGAGKMFRRAVLHNV